MSGAVTAAVLLVAAFGFVVAGLGGLIGFRDALVPALTLSGAALAIAIVHDNHRN